MQIILVSSSPSFIVGARFKAVDELVFITLRCDENGILSFMVINRQIPIHFLNTNVIEQILIVYSGDVTAIKKIMDLLFPINYKFSGYPFECIMFSYGHS